MKALIKQIERNIALIQIQDNSLGVKYEKILKAALNSQADEEIIERFLRRLKNVTDGFLTKSINKEELELINRFLEQYFKSAENQNGGLIISNRKPSLLVSLWDGLKNKIAKHFNKKKMENPEKKELNCELPPPEILQTICREKHGKGYSLSDYVLANLNHDSHIGILTNQLYIDDCNPYIRKSCVLIDEFGNIEWYGDPTSENMSICPSFSPSFIECIKIETKNSDENTKYIPYPKDIVSLSDQQKEALVPLNIRGLEGQYFHDKDKNRIYRKLKTCPERCKLSDGKEYSKNSEIFLKVDLIPFEKQQYEGKVMWVATQPVFSGIPYINKEPYRSACLDNDYQYSLARRKKLFDNPVVINYLNGTFLTEVKELADICREKKIFGDNIDSVQTRCAEERQKRELPDGIYVPMIGGDDEKLPYGISIYDEISDGRDPDDRDPDDNGR